MRRLLWVCLLVSGLMLSWSIVIAGDFYVNPSGSCGGNTPCYTTIQAAIDSASTGSILIALETYGESLVLDESKALTLQGGWNSTFTTQSGNSTLNSMTISGGTVTVENLVLQRVDTPVFLRDGSYSFKRDFFGIYEYIRWFHGDYAVYSKYLTITVRQKEDWTEGFARWIFDTITIQGRVYQIVFSESEQTPSRIYAQYLGLFKNSYGYFFFHYNLHFPESADPSYSIRLTPVTFDDEWTPPYHDF